MGAFFENILSVVNPITILLALGYFFEYQHRKCLQEELEELQTNDFKQGGIFNQ